MNSTRIYTTTSLYPDYLFPYFHTHKTASQPPFNHSQELSIYPPVVKPTITTDQRQKSNITLLYPLKDYQQPLNPPRPTSPSFLDMTHFLQEKTHFPGLPSLFLSPHISHQTTSIYNPPLIKPRGEKSHPIPTPQESRPKSTTPFPPFHSFRRQKFKKPSNQPHQALHTTT